MYVRVRVNSAYTEIQLDWTEVITCPHCQARWKGQVFARAHGRGKTYNAYTAPDDDGALEAAGIDAFANAVDTGKAMLRRARCLRCRKRMGAVDSLVIKTVFAYGVIAGVVIFTARMLARTDAWRGDGSVLVPLLAIPLASVLIWLTVNRELAKSDQRVQLGPVGEIGAHPATQLEDRAPADRLLVVIGEDADGRTSVDQPAHDRLALRVAQIRVAGEAVGRTPAGVGLPFAFASKNWTRSSQFSLVTGRTWCSSGLLRVMDGDPGQPRRSYSGSRIRLTIAPLGRGVDTAARRHERHAGIVGGARGGQLPSPGHARVRAQWNGHPLLRAPKRDPVAVPRATTGENEGHQDTTDQRADRVHARKDTTTFLVWRIILI